MITYLPEGIDTTVVQLQTAEGTWQTKKGAAKAPELSGQGDAPRMAYETAKRYQEAYDAFLRLGEGTRKFFAAAKAEIVAADNEAASQFERR